MWFRLLYYARASEFLGYVTCLVIINITVPFVNFHIGPMVVIFGQVSGNIAQYLVIILSVFIPYGETVY